MKRYEKEIQSPVFSIGRGELIRGALIQVQKLKVDSEEAMVTLDAVLSANEINFQIGAIIPAVGAVAVGLWGLKRALQIIFQGAFVPNYRSVT